MKILFGTGLSLMIAALVCSCSSRHVGPAYHAGDENPPPFLTGPVGLVLTNLNGFSARVNCTITTAEAGTHLSSGILLGREGRLLFQPTLGLKGKRARTEGGLFFIWDVPRHSGYVVSEALQSYAPVKTDVEQGSRLILDKEGVQQEINGHPSHKCEAEVEMSDGNKERLILWQADDQRHFPGRIEAVRGFDRMTLDFSEVRLEFPSQQLFLPPDGFEAYASSVALMNELIVRDASFAKTRQAGEFEEPTDVRTSNWHDSGTTPIGR